MNGSVTAICIAPHAGAPMFEVPEVEAIAGSGLHGDRYSTGNGSFNKGVIGKRQVTFMNALFFENSGFNYIDSRRNIMTRGVELMWLIGRDFEINGAIFRGIKYCDPCMRPSKLSGKKLSFKDTFSDRGGLVADVIQGGHIHVGSEIIPPPRGY